jgi:hypothetical protein
LHTSPGRFDGEGRRARSAAIRWVAQHARPDTGFRGAYFSGSTVGLPDDAEPAPSCDIDIFVVTAREDAPAKPGKLRFQGVLPEVGHLPWTELTFRRRRPGVLPPGRQFPR